MSYDGRTIDGFRGFSHLDTRILEAWSITKGDPNVGIANVDELSVNHEDLPTIKNVTENGIVLNDNDEYDFDHGTQTAGIMVGQHNDVGIRGVSPNSPYYQIDAYSDFFPAFEGISKWERAAQNYNTAIGILVEENVGVLQHTVNYGSCGHYSPTMHAAMIRFFNEARGGLGGLLTSSAANRGDSCVMPPANKGNVIVAVAAYGLHGKRADYSSFGVRNIISAPSNDPMFSPGVRTTTTSPTDFTKSREYEDNFGGTSAAAPLVAGVASLIFAANPELTAGQAQQILLSSAQDVGEPGYDSETGYGFIDAYAAVKKAKELASEPFVDLTATPYLAALSETVTFSASGRRLPQGELIYRWDLGNGVTLDGETVTHRFEGAGEYKVNLSVLLNEKEIANDMTYIYVTQPANDVPQSHLGNSDSGFSGEAPFELKYWVGYRDNDNSHIIEMQRNTAQYIKCDMGDGGTVSAKRVEYIYQNPGIFENTCTVTDPLGASSQFSFTVNVYEQVVAPQPVISYKPSTDPEKDNGLSIEFGAGESVPGTLGYIDKYLWDFGDGDTSDHPFPTKTYDKPGSYMVSLTVSDRSGKSATTQSEIVVD